MSIYIYMYVLLGSLTHNNSHFFFPSERPGSACARARHSCPSAPSHEPGIAWATSRTGEKKMAWFPWYYLHVISCNLYMYYMYVYIDICIIYMYIIYIHDIIYIYTWYNIYIHDVICIYIYIYVCVCDYICIPLKRMKPSQLIEWAKAVSTNLIQLISLSSFGGNWSTGQNLRLQSRKLCQSSGQRLHRWCWTMPGTSI